MFVVEALVVLLAGVGVLSGARDALESRARCVARVVPDDTDLGRVSRDW